MSVEVQVLDDPARACTAMLLDAAVDGANVVLAGGSTPRAAYQEFVSTVRSAGADLHGVTLWFGDERCVPPDDDRSNYRMVKEALLDPLAAFAREPAVHRMKGELGPHAGAEEYESELRAAGPPRFDLLIVGMGPDGHTLSLFPDQPTIAVRDRLVVGTEQAGLEPFVPRISLTLEAVAAAEQVVLLAEGDSKAGAVAAAFGSGAAPDPHVPSSMLATASKQLKLLLDHAAAAQLSAGEAAAGR